MAHLVPVELFRKQLRSVMLPLSSICSLPGQDQRQSEGWEGRMERVKDREGVEEK